MDESSTTTASQPRGSPWLAFLGLCLALVGAVFTGVLWQAWQRAEATRRWIATPAKVLSSQVRPEQASPNSPMKYRVIVRYEYAVQGKTFVSERIKRSEGAKGDRDDAESLREEFTPSQTITCFVNPADLKFAILRHDTRAPLYTIWFPLLFVVGGLRMAWGALRRR
jgi:hypothetical protein